MKYPAEIKQRHWESIRSAMQGSSRQEEISKQKPVTLVKNF